MLEIAIYINLFSSILNMVLLSGMVYIAYLEYKKKNKIIRKEKR